MNGARYKEQGAGVIDYMVTLLAGLRALRQVLQRAYRTAPFPQPPLKPQLVLRSFGH